MEAILNNHFSLALGAIPLLIAIYQGIVSTFEIKDKKLIRNIIAIVMCLWTTYNILTGWTDVTIAVDTFFILYFGASGVIDFGKQFRK